MNREIKFRGKRADNGEWVYGYLSEKYFYADKKYVILVEYTEARNFVEYEVIPETVGQFTGLLDKNGKEIYEGDIILMCACGNAYGCGDGDKKNVVKINRIYVVEHETKDYVTTLISSMWLRDTCMYSSCPTCFDKQYEVIGNIHDNPELLKPHKP